jgi:hypothetical protein
MDKIFCKECGRPHDQILADCCWIDCPCGFKICGSCGSANLQSMDINEGYDRSYHWCNLECIDCGLVGCAMCGQ